MTNVNTIIFGLFVVSAILFILNSYFALKRDYAYLGNQAFAFAFIFMGVFSVGIGLTSVNLNLDLNFTLILLIALFSLILGFFGMFISSLVIKVGANAITLQDIVMGGLPMIIPLLGVLLLCLQGDQIVGLVGFIFLFSGLGYYGSKISNTFSEAMEDADEKTKYKIQLWTYSFGAFGILSVIGWGVASFFANTEWGSLIGLVAPVANLVGSSLMLYSFTLE